MPFPANYGGVIDVYYKLYWLKQAGIKIYLHCFTYGRAEAKELELLCEKVYYYKRKTGLLANLSLLPYTVKSRQSKELENNLLSNDFPILFEVLHTCYLLGDSRFTSRKKIYRHSNIEHDYYNELAKTEKSILKKVFLKIEAQKLKWFEPIIKHANLILAVNQKDATYFKEKYPSVETQYLPSFHANAKIDIKTGTGDYVLFHGNLGISENYEAAMWLIQNVFSKVQNRVVIAGLNPPDFLKQEIQKYQNIELASSLNSKEMDELIVNAQMHVLYTLQPTGLKLKLLNVLFKGRFVVCNANMLSGTSIGADSTILLAESAKGFIELIQQCNDKNFTNDLLIQREKQILNFDNQTNAKKLIELVF